MAAQRRRRAARVVAPVPWCRRPDVLERKLHGALEVEAAQAHDSLRVRREAEAHARIQSEPGDDPELMIDVRTQGTDAVGGLDGAERLTRGSKGRGVLVAELLVAGESHPIFSRPLAIQPDHSFAKYA